MRSQKPKLELDSRQRRLFLYHICPVCARAAIAEPTYEYDCAGERRRGKLWLHPRHGHQSGQRDRDRDNLCDIPRGPGDDLAAADRNLFEHTLFGPSKLGSATAVINGGTGSNPSGNCLLALGNTSPGNNNLQNAIYLNGNMTINVSNCGLYSDLTDCTSGSYGEDIGGSSVIDAGSSAPRAAAKYLGTLRSTSKTRMVIQFSVSQAVRRRAPKTMER
jgi:hypothetical protein